MDRSRIDPVHPVNPVKNGPTAIRVNQRESVALHLFKMEPRIDHEVNDR